MVLSIKSKNISEIISSIFKPTNTTEVVQYIVNTYYNTSKMCLLFTDIGFKKCLQNLKILTIYNAFSPTPN